jgi:protein-S-isoprenylcysteine O-methyltransferase Ste14
MTALILLASSILVTAILAWLLRRRLAASTLACLPRKESMKKVILLASIGMLATFALLPDILIIASLIQATRKLRFVVTALALSAALFACIGCSKQAEPPKPHEIHWQGPETGYSGMTELPPDNTGKPKEEP